MKLKIDENLPIDVAAHLQSAGHDVETVQSEGLVGSPDERIAEACRAEGRALMTLDTDFGNIRAFPPADHPGIIVLRPSSQDRPALLRTVSKLMGLLDQEPLAQRLWIVGEHRLKIRR